MPRGLLGRLVVSFALAILCFCGSTLYVQFIQRSVDDGALSIATNAMPSIEALAETRGELRRLDVAITRFLATRSDADRRGVEEARHGVDVEVERYLSQPETYPGEQALWAQLHRSLRAVDDAVGHVLEDPRVAGIAAAKPVTGAINDAAGSLRGLIDFNADRGRQLAVRIQDDHRRAVRIALLLDLLSTVFTLLAGWMAVRALQHHHRVVAERNQLVARRADELEQFAGRVAHDILGPLSATRLAVDLARSKVDDAAVARTLERGRRGVDRVTSIVDGLRFARAGARPEPGAITSVLPVVQNVVGDLQPEAQAAGVTLTLLPSPPAAIHGHAGVVASVVENLVRNAIKYMGERPVRRVDVELSTHDRFVRLEVRDTGPGIPPALVDTIFDPYVRGRTNHQPGIGLGLATVKRVAESHGGKAGLRSRLDEGTTFWVELPRADYDDDSRANRAKAQAGK